MKRSFLILVLVWLCVGASALGETLGFGFVNTDRVNVRRTPGGEMKWRLDEGHCVWIKDTRKDGKGRVWYKINFGIHDVANYDRTGYILADYVDAGEAIWHDIVQIDADKGGLLARRSDGSVAWAGLQYVGSEGAEAWADSRKGVRQVLAGFHTYVALEADGSLSGVGIRLSNDFLRAENVRLLGGSNDLLAAITQDGRLLINRGQKELDAATLQSVSPDVLQHVTQISGYERSLLLRLDDGRALPVTWDAFVVDLPYQLTMPDFTAWTDMIDVGTMLYATGVGEPYTDECWWGVRGDGSVLASPAWLQEALASWQGMRAVRVEHGAALGLRQDGTCVFLPFNDVWKADVSDWTDIVEIAMGWDFCVGLRADGTLAFAGDHIFYGERP